MVISADYLFDGEKIRSGFWLETDSIGRILRISDDDLPENAAIYKGILCPGFINAHCHLELSHLKDQIEREIGLPDFIRSVVALRQADGSTIDKAMKLAEEEMINNGIVAVGDISNSEASFPTKAMNRLRYHTFIELLGPTASRANDLWKHGKLLKSRLKQFYPQTSVSITPHAPYSVSKELFTLLFEHESAEVFSIHNQETATEEAFFTMRKGKLYELMCLFARENLPIKKGLKNSIDFWLELLPTGKKMMLVHNTFSSQYDLDFLSESGKNVWFCLCPNANLYIENRLPQIENILSESSQILIGTDSLASNQTLSVLEELKCIATSFNFFKLEEMLKWITSNPANYFGWEDIGYFKEGMIPGVNVIENVNDLTIKKESKVVPIFGYDGPIMK